MRMRDLIDLLVPHYLIITIISPLAACYIIGDRAGVQLLLGIAALSLSMLGFNILNMVVDKDLDRINKPKRPLPSGRVSVRLAIILSAILYMAGIFISMSVGAKLLAVILAFVIVSFLYTNPLTYLKKNIWASSIVGAILYGIVPLLVAWSVSDKPLPLEFLGLFGLLIFFIAPSKDLEDMRGEKKRGIKSLPVLIGAKNTMLFIIIGVLATLATVACLAILSVIRFHFLYASVMSAVLFIMVNRKYLSISDKDYSNVVTQSEIVSANMLAIVVIEVIFAVFSVI